jgi:hypothetical protein
MKKALMRVASDLSPPRLGSMCDLKHLDRSKLTSYYKTVEALPVDPIAAAAALGWRNVFSMPDHELTEVRPSAVGP